MTSDLDIETVEGWTRKQIGNNSNPGCFSDGSGGLNFSFVNRAFPGITGRTHIAAGCRRGGQTDWFEVDRLSDRDLADALVAALKTKKLRSLVSSGYVSVGDIGDNIFSSPEEANKVIQLLRHLP